MVSLKVYIITRLLMTIPMILILLTLVFFIMRILPGDPVLAIVGMKASPEQIERIRHELGLDKDWLHQYIDYITMVFSGNLGNSMIWGRRPVINEIWDRFPATLELSIGGFIVSVILGLLTGVFSSIKQGTKTDVGLRLFSIIAYSLFIPLLGMIFQLIFGVYLRLFPVAGRKSPLISITWYTGLYTIDSLLSGSILGFFDAIWHLILPSLTLGIVLSGVYTRLVRSSMLDVLAEDFIRALRARGIPENSVLFKHALKNAFIPILTMMGLQFALLLAGAVLTETTFSWPGVGTFLMERIEYRDYTTVQGTIVFYAFLVALVSLIVDIIYAYIDPRIRY
ncbi:MAG: ABC transporter permease [Candidatus Aenigmatarchaeota archaeon]|nr:MAG: ABC transporter permease [Candidatus Aenigmarchaeota archaeon]